ncbi:MAG: PAS domain S-box protein [Mucilaginibacter polytrichastri]|nr:PAS domain S-box protein [Mucilaginibacter polytrichastri]
MSDDPSHEAEQKRIDALLAYQILDTATEADYDELTELAAAICDTPIALVSLVDSSRQWFKSHRGLDARETPRSQSFCAHAILQPLELMEIPDAREDTRFRDNPLVTGNPHIAFYAGMPLVDSEGHALGSLCVIDRKPRELSQAQRSALRTLAKQVVGKLELRKRNRELEASEARIKNILDIVGEGIGITGPDGKITYTNEKARAIFGISPETALERSSTSAEWVNRRVDGSALPDEEHPVSIALNTAAPVYNRVLSVESSDGRQRYIRMNATPIKNALGSITGAIGSFADITDSYNLQAESARLVTLLREKEETLRLTIEASRLGAFSLDLHTGEVILNHYGRVMYGFGKDEVIGPEDGFAMMGEDEHRIRTAINKAVNENTPFEEEYRITRKTDGSLLWVRSNGRVLLSDDGSTLRFYGTIADITEQKEEEKRKSDFIGIVSHELRTPLTSLNGYVQILAIRARKSGDMAVFDIANRAQRQVDRMRTLISGFLDVARIGEGKISLNPERFDAGELLKIIHEESSASYPTHQLVFEPVSELFLHADRDKIEQVLNNLINNAVKYAPPESVVTVHCSAMDDMVRFTVRDEGTGIAAQDSPYIFDRFYRVNNKDTLRIQGFGIGLYICREIIELHNGKIGVESEPGEGSTFWFSLPLH